ncbi:MAG: glycosyltransferase family 2 protein [Candidatus Gastranaerophilaceae bacterium]
MLNNKIYLDKEFDKFWQKIENGENFAFMRNADGERAIILGEAVSAQEGNWSSPNYISKLGTDIYNSLMLNEENVYYALSCPCCDQPAYYWYLSRIKTKNVTFANLWINANYSKFKEKFPQIKRDAILIANYRAKNHKIGNLNILKHFEIDDDCISFWENQAPQMIENIKKEFGNRTDLLYVVSAGPMSGPIIYELYKNNPNNCYIDFGSAIDIYYRENISRPYMVKGNVYAERNCWMNNPETTNFDVSVVLNLYKRPENLQLQLNALERQTLKPKEIILYQDGTSDIVNIPDSIKHCFDFIEIGQENKGVWERFRFAQKYAKSKYVCVFDDDTIPGSRWLENCHTEMLKQEGLYGTIGIVLKDQAEKYPIDMNSSCFRVGWDGNLEHTTEVDFVGHSWFLKKEWLKYLFEAPSEIQKYKLCGEDMAFSYELLKHGIKTFVPPHPQNNYDLFGSIPEYAFSLGTDVSAISMTSPNLLNMQKCTQILLNNNWQILKKRNPRYISKIKKELMGEPDTFFAKEEIGDRRIIHIGPIKISYKTKKHLKKQKRLVYEVNAFLKEINSNNNSELVFAHNVYNRFDQLVNTIKTEHKLFPQARIIVAYNHPEIHKFLEKSRNTCSNDLFFYEGTTHQIGCTNGFLSCIKKASKFNKTRCFIFSHDNVHIDNPDIVKEHIEEITSGKYDVIARTPKEEFGYGKEYIMCECVYLSSKVITQVSTFDLIKNETDILRDKKSNISTERQIYEWVSKCHATKINLLEFDAALYNFQGIHYNKILSEELGFFHVKVGERGWY